MIGYLEGRIIASDEKSVTLKGSDIGWRIFCGPTTLEEWRGTKGVVKAFTHLYVREGIQDLFGFRSHRDLRFFELLLDVSGVGPRSAQHIIDVLSVDVSVSAVQSKQAEIFTRVPGIGSKIAQRIIIDLEPKLKVHGFASQTDLSSLKEVDDAVAALESLGYTRREAREALKEVPETVSGSAQKVEQALKLLGKR